MALGTVIAGLVRNAARSLVNFELAVDPIIERLQQSCPPKAELEAIIRQKNSITTALTQVQTALNTMVQTGQNEYKLRFDSAVPLGKDVVVIHGFD